MMALAPEVTAAIVAAIFVLAIDEFHTIENKDRLRISVAADINSIADVMISERDVELTAFFSGSVHPLTSWDRVAQRVGDLPEQAVEPVATFYSRLRGLIGIIPKDATEAGEWRRTGYRSVVACGLWAIYRLKGGDFPSGDWTWMRRIQDKAELDPDKARRSCIGDEREAPRAKPTTADID
jgi:hypothetical protein